MGIQCLLQFMKPYIKPVHIKKYAGKRVGIDAYSWLHKGAYSCSLELCQNSEGEKKSRYLQYFMHRIELLRHYKVIPVVVFDGGNIPCKSDTQGERGKKRQANLALAREQLSQGNLTAAVDLFQKAVSVTPSMAHQLIQILKSKNVEFVVAPYEADAQLAYLSSLDVKQGGIEAVITEDSDLMAYGCKSVIFKMDKYGKGEEILLDKALSVVASTEENKKLLPSVPSFQNFDKELFTGMCVLAGCDFLPSITGIGIRRAYTLVSKYKNLDRVLSVLKFDKGNQIPEDYAKSFKKAVAVFQYARVFDARTKTIKPMKPIPEELLKYFDGDLDFLGPEISSSVAVAIANGHLDPITKEAFNVGSSQDPIVPKSNNFPHFPTVKDNQDLLIPKSNHLKRADRKIQEISTKGSCFTVFSCETSEAKMEVLDLEPTIDEKKYLNEAFALQKLVVPQKLPHNHKSIDEVKRREYPDNNPFKKRKVDDIHLVQSQCIIEEVSMVTDEIKSEEISCLTPEARNDAGSMKTNLVTDDENSEIICLTPKSQESVNSKPSKKIADIRRVMQKKETTVKRKNTCKTQGSNTSSILNFFTRL